MVVHKRSFLRKLTILNVLVSGTALLLACFAFFAYDQVTFRQNLVHTLSAQAQIIGSNSVSALLFNDPQAANTTLSALKNSPTISSAGILTSDQRVFAQYTRSGAPELVTLAPLPQDQMEVFRFGSRYLSLIRRITSESKTIGFVYIRADLTEIDRRLHRYALIASGVLLISLLFALLLSSRFRQSVAAPLIRLSDTAQMVSRTRDYSVRVTSEKDDDELAQLVKSFNEMLEEIQRRDTELQAAHDELEKRVSERTRELVLANRELEAFSYSVSHDLRNPLETLNGYTYLLKRQYGEQLGTNGRHVVEQLDAATRRMAELIDDLLALSRVSTGTMHTVRVNLSAIARSVADDLCRTDPARPIHFVISETPEANGDERLLQIAIENLLRNSWKYTSHHEHARIEFGSKIQNRRVIYFVSDDGAGFDPTLSSHLFQPFQRLHSPAEFPGTGVGLAIVQRIVNRHAGEIWAEGAPEKGATFYFTLTEDAAGLSG